ncbi:MAG: TRAP transporter substrate-binding protein DctP [Clostridia bacterium]|nr:TRAP transporter substrate-binding protein DctP [Clostridia bacterium]
MKRTFLQKFASLALAALLLPCGVPALAAAAEETGKTVVLSVGGTGKDSLPPVTLDCADGTHIRLIFFEGGVLGSDTELVRACANGAISIYMGVISGMTQTVPEAALLDIPYLADSRVEYLRMCDGFLADRLQPYFHARGLHLLSINMASMRGVFSREPIRTPADLVVKRLRIMDNSYHEIFWDALGVKTTTISFSQLEYAYRQDRVNAAEFPLNNARAFGNDAIFPYYLATDHLPGFRAQVVNLSTYESLTEAQKEALAEYYRAFTLPGDSTVPAWTEVSVPTEEMKIFLRTGRAAVVHRMKEDLGAEIVEEFLAAVERG